MRISASIVPRLSHMRRGSVFTGAAAVALAASVLPLTIAAPPAAATTTPAVTLTGSLGVLPASTATVIVRAELALHVNAAGVPQELSDVPVATATVTSPSFSIQVPNSATLRQAEQQRHGVVNFSIVVASGTKQTSEYVPAALAVPAKAANAAQLAVTKTRQIRTPAFPHFHTVTAAQIRADSAIPNNGPTCAWYAYGSTYPAASIIGEDHVANTNGVWDQFNFSYQNDMTVSVGLSFSGPDGGYGFDGNIGLTDSLRANGGQTNYSGTVAYLYDHVEYQRYELEVEGHSCNQWMVQAAYSEGDVFYDQSGPHPGVNPWGGCHNDIHAATLDGGGNWGKDFSQAEYYNGIANLFGFSFGGSDGFTTDVGHEYYALHGAQTTYICGTRSQPSPVYSPILYNTP